ncbi:hypothetical protein FKD06_19425 [Serratia sp. SRS-8-S-2018]|uniref:hypothetical protein n=1 Tax=Serratia sp. SRS-8-S-2018 TaxID=2591107 RepID=UPI00114012F3|nr:hypothetical protein [Serratia sp. SRS-8-S-2018]TPW45432.1 hypothetical protein FKD06_19425 [Serratia sp. SRS-8-S-2018]
MKKPQQQYDLKIPNDDHKMATVMGNDKKNFESSDIWVYLAADSTNPGYAKVGITMGDLTDRSYDTGNPNYYMFCAFQCDHRTTQSELKGIERSVFRYLDEIYTNEDGSTKRRCFFESGRLSECYYDIDFKHFFVSLHNYLLEKHIRHFPTGNHFYGDERYALCMHFNNLLPPHVKTEFLNMVLQY